MNIDLNQENFNSSLLVKENRVALSVSWKGNSYWKNENPFCQIVRSIYLNFEKTRLQEQVSVAIPDGYYTKKSVFFFIEYTNTAKKTTATIFPTIGQLKTMKISAYILCESLNGEVLFMNYQPDKVSTFFNLKIIDVPLSPFIKIEAGAHYQLVLESNKPYEITASIFKKEITKINKQIMPIKKNSKEKKYLIFKKKQSLWCCLWNTHK